MLLLDASYKGERNYVQGPDLFIEANKCLDSISTGYILRLSCKRFARNQCQLLITTPPANSILVAEGKWLDSTREVIPFWIAETEIPISKSVFYEEDAIVASASLNGESIISESPNKYSTIENVVTLNKKLNYALSPDIQGKWVFGRIDLLDALPRRWSKLQLRRLSCIANRFSSSRIEVDGKLVGEIRFIVGAP